MTARDLLTASARLGEFIGVGETLTGDEAVNGLAVLNSLLEEWQTQGLTIFTVTRKTHTLVASQASYTIGPSGANITQARPLRVEKATVIATSPTPAQEYPLEVLLEDEWADLTPKALTTAAAPSKLYYNPTNPNGTLHPWPITTASIYQLCLYLPEPVAQVASLSTTLAFPPGYEKCLRYTLAVEWSPEFGRPVSGVVADIARRTLGNIKRMNTRPAVLRVDPALLAYNAGMDITRGA